MNHCAQCGAEITGRFCSACGAAASEPVTVPPWVVTSAPTALATQPTSVRTTRPAQAPLLWHRNGNLALGLGVAALGSTIAWLAGLPLPSVGGMGALVVGIIGWRARNTSTSTTGWWGVACAALALVLTVVGLSGAIKQFTAPPAAAPVAPTARYVAVDVSFDANKCTGKPRCFASVIVRNDGTVGGYAVANLAILGSANLPLGACTTAIPWTGPGVATPIGCFLVWQHPVIGQSFANFSSVQPGVVVTFQYG